MNLHGKVDRIREEIHKRALLLCCDNEALHGQLHTVETAMLMGASIVFEQPIEQEDEGELVISPEAEDLLRQLFEGEDKLALAAEGLMPESPNKWPAKPYMELRPEGVDKTYIGDTFTGLPKGTF
jgi:hypothetical protein